MLSGYADEHLDFRIVKGLRRRGMDVVTAQERGQRQTDDDILLATATAEGRLMLTNDTDFLSYHNDWMLTGKNHAGIVYWPQRFLIGEAIQRIIDYATHTDAATAANYIKYI